MMAREAEGRQTRAGWTLDLCVLACSILLQ